MKTYIRYERGRLPRTMKSLDELAAECPPAAHAFRQYPELNAVGMYWNADRIHVYVAVNADGATRLGGDSEAITLHLASRMLAASMVAAAIAGGVAAVFHGKGSADGGTIINAGDASGRSGV